MKRTCCFGELLIRYSPKLQGEWIRNKSMQAYIGGAELNVATALANWGMPVQYVTVLPDHYLSHEIIQHLEDLRIDTSGILLQGSRIGSYLLPQGADLKHAAVIYDRAGSSFADLATGELDWPSIISEDGWFHFSAISPALNASVADVCLEALQQAKRMGKTISVDLNYRALLWQFGQRPAAIMSKLLPLCDVVMGNIWSAATLLDIPLQDDLLREGAKSTYVAAAQLSAQTIMEKYPNVQVVANTFRFTNDSAVEYYASLHTTNGTAVSATYTTDKVIDKVGSGDCFMAALIRGWQLNKPADYIINFAASAAVGKLQERGDHTNQTIRLIEAQMKQHD